MHTDVFCIGFAAVWQHSVTSRWFTKYNYEAIKDGCSVNGFLFPRFVLLGYVFGIFAGAMAAGFYMGTSLI
mgnify:FL=1